MVERYGFLRYPQTFEDYNTDSGITFQGGSWRGIYIDDIKIFSNGVLLATGESTDHADLLFFDMIELWVTAGFIYQPELVTRMDHISQIVVRSDVSLDWLHVGVAGVLVDFFEGPVGLGAVGFYQGDNPELLPLRIERQAGVPASANQYWSQAPFTTARHLEFLEAFEKALLPSS